MKHVRPRVLEQALSLLAEERWSLLAGGTDFFPAAGDRPITAPVLDVTALEALRGIDHDAERVRIGALSSWSEVIRAPLPPAFDALKLAAREVGSVQIQNKATVVGNLCNASPAADGVPPLLVLDAEVELRSLAGTRLMPVSDFITGNRTTARRPDELVCAVRVPVSAARGASSFLKLGARRYLVISIAMVAARLVCDAQGLIAQAAVAVGACSAVARRLPVLESELLGLVLSASTVHTVTGRHVRDALAPIDDVRASARYRAWAAEECIRRALLGCMAHPT